MLKAALSHFVAVRDRAVANLNNILNNSAGVGEHVDLVGEVVNLVQEIEGANSCVEFLSTMNNSQTTATENSEE
tara:strand:+ start:230 stop:451 length:222 start_codon:yes stop_codon:yes gene_type:complete